jgi:NADH:ubiquinone oxidoreductase subunit 3 (subunit A)
MNGDYTPFQFLSVFLVMAVLFAVGPLFLAWLWARFYSPRKPGSDKSAVYECGIESIPNSGLHFRSEYYLYAIIFLIFDVETVFLMPFAVAFGKLTLGSFLAIALFVLLLVEGLVWAWAKGVLNWK